MGKFPFYVFMGVLLFYIFAAMLISCNPSQENSKEKDVTTISKEDAPVADNTENKDGSVSTGCYQMIIARDTALLQILSGGQRVTGKLLYNRFEKDDNHGDFTGTFQDGKLMLWYTFSSEGMLSVKEVIFKKSGDGFVEAYGDIEMKGDTAYFKYPQALQFEEKHPYTRINCN